MATTFAVFVTTLFIVTAVSPQVCKDLDTQSCQDLLAADATLCSDVSLANFACPETCGVCDLTCYNCSAPVNDHLDCNTTAVCLPGQKCLLSEYESGSVHQYILQCGTELECDGRFGRRDVTTHCCSENMCNNPGFSVTLTTSTTTTTETTTTTRPTTTTSTSKPTTTLSGPYSDCSRDIVVMVEDSRENTADAHVKRFLTDIIDAIPIGPDNSIMALALFDLSVREEWDFSYTQTKEELVTAIWRIQFVHNTNRVDTADVANKVTHFMRSRNGDRLNAPDAVIVINDYDYNRYNSDSSSSSHGSSSTWSRWGKRGVKNTSSSTGYKKRYLSNTEEISGNNIIIVNVDDAIASGAFTDQATSRDHIIDVSSYYHLPDNTKKVLDLICA